MLQLNKEKFKKTMNSKVKYHEYIKSLRWEIKRQEVFRHWGKACAVCGAANGLIDVHHLSYERLGNEQMGDLLPLCRWHHKVIHECGIEARLACAERQEIPEIVRQEEAKWVATDKGRDAEGMFQVRESYRVMQKPALIAAKKAREDARAAAVKKQRNKERSEKAERKRLAKLQRMQAKRPPTSEELQRRKVESQRYIPVADVPIGQFRPSCHY